MPMERQHIMVRSTRLARTLAATNLIAVGALTALAVPAAVAAPAPERATIAAPADADGDGLLDAWETGGYDADNDGVVDVNLPAMGASPNHKDLFVETDYMSGRLPTSGVYDRIVNVFATAPVSNPDGVSGIKIHLDAGGALGSSYNLGGGNQVPYDSNLRPAWKQTNGIKSANFDSRRAAVFYYMIFADDYDSSCSSGYSFAIPGDTFIVTMGPRCNWHPDDDMQVGTFVHELGHALGLRHGGTDNVNYKPNYLSVMNYAFQFDGVPKSSGGSYFGYSNVAPAPLDETSLSEPAGLGSSASAWKTYYTCPDGTHRWTTTPGDQPINWNCDGDATDTGLRADVNDDNNYTVLTAQNNWASIVFGGGAVGGGSRTTGGVTTLDGERELTKAEWLAHRRTH
jgi:hypothetical protein